MSFWISVTPRDAPRDLGVDVAGYTARVHNLAAFAHAAVERAAAGAKWLRRGFPANSYLRLDLVPHLGDSVQSEHLRTRNQGGAKEIIYLVRMPVAWFDVPGDGLLAIRIFRALLTALATVGAEHHLGLVPLLSRESDPGRPELPDLFTPLDAQPSALRSATGQLQEVMDRARPDQFVGAAAAPVDQQSYASQLGFVRSLGRVDEEFVIPGSAREGVQVWVVRQEP